MAATHGHLGEFDSIQEDWESYIEHPQQYFTVNDVQSADKQKGNPSQLLWSVDISPYEECTDTSQGLQMLLSMTL